MIRYAIWLIISVGGLSARADPVMAWGKEGHEIVCFIAWAEMTPAAREQVKGILSIHGREEFAAECNWADGYRFSHKNTGPWHFLNVGPNEKSIDLSHDFSAAASCVVAQINEDVEVLRRESDHEKRAMALKFLAHFIGDVHQPLHVSFAEDKGGNEIKGRYFKRQANLHAVWDSGMLREDGRPVEQLSDTLESEISAADRKSWALSGPLDWANESLAITLAPATRYVDHGDTFRLGEAYQRRNLPIVHNRLSRAGVRLGHLLNEVLK